MEKDSLVITAKMNPEVSQLESDAWDIWKSIRPRDAIRMGFTSKAEILATALIQWKQGHNETPESDVIRLLKQILSKLNNGYVPELPFTQDESEILIDFAQNRQMLDDLIGG